MTEIPHDFILDGLHPMPVRIKKMFGNYAVYGNNKILLATRHNTKRPIDNGIWIGTSQEYHESLLNQFKSIRHLKLYNIKKWLLLPEEAEDFEEVGFEICALIKSSDPRIGVAINE